MLAPIDKLNSRVNDIIQIVITTACTLRCSNCTQLLPFRQDYRHMSLDCFRLAVESLIEWPGVIGIFGGNPCNHPKFPEICEILCEVVPDQRRRGLWSNDLLGHGEIAKKTFFPDGRFNLNAHAIKGAAAGIMEHLPGKIIQNSMYQQAEHAAILTNYRDLGITPAEWATRREGCDINQKWSAAIVERDHLPYAYFCEVAAALDGVRGLNSGIPAVTGWWRRSIETEGFQNQIRTCCDAGCGVPLKFKGHQDNAETYDITPSWAEILPQQKQVTVECHTTIPGTVKETTDYMKARS